MLMGMNCDDEKTVVISPTSTTNEWPQNMISNDHSHNSMIINNNNNNKSTMAHSSSTPQQPQDHPQQNQQQQQQSLKCPRCDSANTKFCYYNNYSLSQPRHFCKACKRYWTRGGTLRNVPVGGGCRKNKRLKRPSSSSSAAAATSSGISPSLLNSSGDSHIDQLTGSNPSHVGSSLFYGHSHDMSLPFSSSSRYEQPHHHLSAALGLGFSNNGDGGYQSSLLSSYSSIFGGSSSPTIASLLASKFSSGAGFQALAPFEELNIAGISGGHGDRYNDNNNNKQGVKLESDGQGRSSASALGWINGVGVGVGLGGGNDSATTCSDHHHQNNNNNNHQTDQIGLSSSDPSLYWPTNPTAVGGGNWLDPMANLGSNNSVPSLI